MDFRPRRRTAVLTPFVLDASVAASWLLPDERHPLAEAAMERMRRGRAVAPTIFWYEIRNMLLVNERRKRIDAGQGRAALKVLRALPIDEDRDAEETHQMDLARRRNL